MTRDDEVIFLNSSVYVLILIIILANVLARLLHSISH